jgi:Tfp pilus assembly protein PilX
MSARLHKLSGERGAAIVIAIMTMTVTAGLATALFAGATGFVHSSSRDAANKRALAAAEAGLSVGAYRFSRISLSPSGSFASNCVTDKEVAWSSSAPHCPAATGYFNQTGASSSYYLTPDMGTALAGMSTVATECGGGSGERCLTAVGTVNGVTRRLQERLKSAELFSIHGMLGLTGTKINSSESWSGANFKITSDTASNGPITFGENVSAPGAPYHCEIGPSGSAPCGAQNLTVPTITVPSVDTLPFGTTQTTNSDSTITLAQGYTAGTRSLSVPAGATLTLAAGDYNFCFVTLGTGATLSAASEARVKIYVDSPARTGSGCTSPTGGKLSVPSGQLNLGSTQGQLEFYLYGTATPPANLASPPPATCNADFNFVDAASGPSSNLYVYAPDSTVSLESHAYQMGAIAACKLTYWAQSASARWDYPPGGTRPSNGITVATGSFRECTPQYTGDPESSCG